MSDYDDFKPGLCNNEMKSLFVMLKTHDGELDTHLNALLYRIEKNLYNTLTVGEMLELQERAQNIQP